MSPKLYDMLVTDTDSEEDSMKDGWRPHAMLDRSGPCAQIPGQYTTSSKKKRLSSKRTSASSFSSCLKSKQGVKERKQKHFALLLQEAGVSSSEDSFDQGY